MDKFRVAALVVAIVLIIGLTIILLAVFFNGPHTARTTTDCGEVEGIYEAESSAYSFKGIPFAAAPVGQRRWHPTEPLEGELCWRGVYEAKQFPPECAQDLNGQVSGKEDCLYLNIFTPTLDPNASLPVMVWIHGGYLLWVNGSTPGYCPDAKLSSTLNMVHVSIQYRLGGLGFLVLNELPGKGNYGILDQIEALKWTKRNIANFGGNPNLVTIYGQSSGGTAVWALLMSPLSKGLFHRAVSLSQSGKLNVTLEEARKVNSKVLLQPGSVFREKCPGMTKECFMNLGYEDAAKGVYPFWNDNNTFMDVPTPGEYHAGILVIDGEVIPSTRYQSDVPVLFGSTAQETDFLPPLGEQQLKWNFEELSNYTAYRFEPFRQDLYKAVLQQYPWKHDAVYVITSISSDIRVNCPINEVARRASQELKSPVYRYVLTSHPSSAVKNALGISWDPRYAFHCWDTSAFFDYMEPVLSEGVKESDKKLRDILHEEIAHFVKTGSPKNPRWLPYKDSETTALVSDRLDFVHTYHRDQCQLWEDNGMNIYSWIN